MKCARCGNEIEEGKLLCDKCGEEVKVVPDYDYEIESKIKQTMSRVIEDIDDELPDEDTLDEDSLNEDSLDEDEYDDSKFIATPGNIFSNKAAIAIIVLVAIVVVSVIIVFTVRNSQNDSFEYQYQNAVTSADNGQYADAISYMERALAIDSTQVEARVMLAEYYIKANRTDSAKTAIEELLRLDDTQISSYKESLYDMLFDIYVSTDDYESLGTALSECDIQSILDKYNTYAALEPVFSEEEGEYEEVISIALSANTDGDIYYTLDGSTPDEHSSVYKTPILLESGEYTIKAMFVNTYGVESKVATKVYDIALSAPNAPSISLESGDYVGPRFIEIFHEANTKVYYTTDSTTPDANSNRYTKPLEMPYGISNFSFVAINEDGISSEVVSRTYHMSVSETVTPDLCLQVVKNNLLVNGEILDMEGHVDGKLGTNQYEIRTIVDLDGQDYYIVEEIYRDTVGKEHSTNNLYAVNANDGSLYKTRKVSEGDYILITF